jgi:hypothetical protein
VLGYVFGGVSFVISIFYRKDEIGMISLTCDWANDSLDALWSIGEIAVSISSKYEGNS